MFAIADDVLDLCRSVGHEATVLAVLADGLRNGPGDGSVLHDAVAAAGDLSAPHPHLEAWRDVYRAFGAKPQRTPCSAEALRKRAARGDLPSVNRLVDAYNAVSIRFAVPIGGEDRAALVGTERLVRSVGDESFDTVKDGLPVVETPEPGEVIWRDDLGVTCRRWNWRQGRRTALTDATTSAVFLLEGLDTDLTPAATLLCELLDADSVRIERLA
ncbi:phenylalanine--tRNA ligase beta subunit-related protein [Dactylosporangium sp. AC04546]|uniref:B3/B4 domain-containing protein n=1 Tax=Dactylosporangium sp. AC04546 TaxID=2862460 RepID=UPI001EE0312D|nr:phenylalanine--tRNA ligase beta subunit-related protein [Dactylosporangium sp. AC04546]WVK82796.1 phenylalanine--tRNA ligase beta subunit-related protein [Dactylosporangium sp. AC04546]